MINWGVMGATYAMLHAVHGVADYWLQTDWQAQNKTKNWKALLSHVVIYSMAFWCVGWVLLAYAGLAQWKCAVLPLVIGIPHGWMDRRKFLMWFCDKAKGWKYTDLEKIVVENKDRLNIAEGPVKLALTAAVRTHVVIHMDQKFHYLCLMLTAMWLAWGIT